MRTLTSLLLSALLVAACTKKSDNTHIQPGAKAGPSANPIANSLVKSQPLTAFTPYTDTFYGTVCQSDWRVPVMPDDGVGETYFYVRHTDDGHLQFSSHEFVVFGYYMYASDYFPVNSSNYYLDQFKKSRNYTSFELRGDSLIYNNLSEHCPDDDRVYFAGKRISNK